ncbi:hypothetical protein [Microcoleus sp. herbarium14]|uniref:hypothetical protein n=1 Tax=Microcoleus sp. herbarium14 TaxID=3055439 RepID=UPI002FCF8AB1
MSETEAEFWDRQEQIYNAEREKRLLATKIRDAFRILAWQFFRRDLDETKLDERYTQFYRVWGKHRIQSMDYYELAAYTIEKGFSIPQLLLMREIYYGIHDRKMLSHLDVTFL